MTKRLAKETRRGASGASLYGRQLAQIHHDHFSGLAREAAKHLLSLLDNSDRVGSGTIVELACGGGVSSGILVDAGYAVVGVDSSDSMIELARRCAPKASFVRASLWDFDLPPALAITATGEAFCYNGPGGNPTFDALEARLQAIFAALTSGGVLLFDVATPSRSGPTGQRRAAWEQQGTFVYLEEREDTETSSLDRTIDTFVPEAARHRHDRERHRLTLYDANQVEETLDRIGFRCRQRTKVGSFELLPGWVAFEAVKA